jgi:hypothetical protein
MADNLPEKEPDLVTSLNSLSSFPHPPRVPMISTPLYPPVATVPVPERKAHRSLSRVEQYAYALSLLEQAAMSLVDTRVLPDAAQRSLAHEDLNALEAAGYSRSEAHLIGSLVNGFHRLQTQVQALEA